MSVWLKSPDEKIGGVEPMPFFLFHPNPLAVFFIYEKVLTKIMDQTKLMAGDLPHLPRGQQTYKISSYN